MRLLTALSTVGLMGLYQASLMVSLPWLIEHSGLPAGLWSALLAAGMLLVIVGGPLWGRHADHLGPVSVMRLTLGLVVAGYLMLVLALLGLPSGGWLVAVVAVTRILHGVGAGGVFPSTQRFLLASRPVARWSFDLARLQAANQVGRLLGPAVMAVASLWSVPLGLCVIALLGVGIWLLQWLQVRQVETARQERKPVSPPDWRSDWPLYLLALVLTLWVGQLQFVLGPYLQHLLALDATAATRLTGIYLMLASVTALLVGPLGHHWLAGNERVLSMTWQFSLTLGGVVLAFADRAVSLGVGIVLVMVGLSLATPWYGSLLRSRWSSAQGQVSGRLTSVHTTGYGIGTLIGGGILEWQPAYALGLFVALGPIAALCFQAHLRLR